MSLLLRKQLDPHIENYSAHLLIFGLTGGFAFALGFAAGEAAGFGGGGMHGYRALEGTFLGGCLFSGRVVAGAVASQGG